MISFSDSGRLCASWEFNFDKTYVFNDSFLITFTSDYQEQRHGFVLSYVERKYNATEEQTSMTTTEASTKYQTTDVSETIPTTILTDSTTVIQQSTSGSTTTVQPDTFTVVPTTGASFSSETVSVSETSTKYKTTDTIETTETIIVDSTTTIQPGRSNYDSTLIEVDCSKFGVGIFETS